MKSPSVVGALIQLVNWTITPLEQAQNTRFDTVRGVFPEGEAAFPGSYKIEEFLIREGFHPTTAKEKAPLRKNDLWGMPAE